MKECIHCHRQFELPDRPVYPEGDCVCWVCGKPLCCWNCYEAHIVVCRK